jgi:hypothetical protein
MHDEAGEHGDVARLQRQIADREDFKAPPQKAD